MAPDLACPILERPPRAMPKLHWEDFTAGQVAEYGPQTVTAEEIKAFAAEFDPQPMHLDEEAALQSLVVGLCASGWHSCAIMMRIVADGFILDSSSMGATGCEEIKWLPPGRAGGRLCVGQGGGAPPPPAPLGEPPRHGLRQCPPRPAQCRRRARDDAHAPPDVRAPAACGGCRR